MSLFGRKRGGDEADRPRQAHRQYRYLITLGWTQEWVHCPICMSKNDGWAGWKPLYTGGVVHAEVPIYNGSAETHTVALACTCEEATVYMESQRMKPWDGATTSILLQKPALVLWDRRLDTERPAGIPLEPDPEKMNAVNEAMSRQLQRHVKGDITAQQFAENQRALMEKHLGPPVTVASRQGGTRPTVGDVSDTGMELPF